MHLKDVEFNITYENNQGIMKVRPLLRTQMSLNDTHFSQMLTVWFFNLMGWSDIMFVLKNTINHSYFLLNKHNQ